MAQTPQVPIELTDLPLELPLEIVEHLDNDVDRACLVLPIHNLEAYFVQRPDHTLTRYLSSEWEEDFRFSDLERHEARYSILNRISRDNP